MTKDPTSPEMLILKFSEQEDIYELFPLFILFNTQLISQMELGLIYHKCDIIRYNQIHTLEIKNRVQ